jgi:NADPH:quinone reductase-like Zn-dependent oxidoreductase
VFALQFHEYGNPDVLSVGDCAEPHAGPGQVRIATRAVSVNPFDWKVRAGYLDGLVPVEFPAIPGVDASGIVDEVGEGVDGIQAGEEVFGLGSRTSSEFAVLDHVTRKPASLTFEEAAALGLAVESAARSLDLLDLRPGSTLLIDGAAGGVGSAATQLAVARGAKVIGTASPANHDYLRSLGATPTTYGPGLPERVEPLAPNGIDAAIDVAGAGSVPDLIAITGAPPRVVTLADFSAAQLGVHLADTSTGRAYYALADAAALHGQSRFTVAIQQVFHLEDCAEAHRLSQGGHVRGKLVLTVP